jgi:hypothetical protein
MTVGGVEKDVEQKKNSFIIYHQIIIFKIHEKVLKRGRMNERNVMSHKVSVRERENKSRKWKINR